jgi:hypothetical protein
MKKKLIGLVATIALLSTVSVTTLAANENGLGTSLHGNATALVEKLASLTNLSADELTAEKVADDLTYGELAVEYGVEDEFRTFGLDTRIDRVNQLVSDERITQEQADEIIATMNENSDNCTGEPQEHGSILKEYMTGQNLGSGNSEKGSRGNNGGNANGSGLHTQDGSCVTE